MEPIEKPMARGPYLEKAPGDWYVESLAAGNRLRAAAEEAEISVVALVIQGMRYRTQ